MDDKEQLLLQRDLEMEKLRAQLASLTSQLELSQANEASLSEHLSTLTDEHKKLNESH